MARVDITELDIESMVNLGNKIFTHVTGAHVVALTMIGDRLGLFEALADHGPATSVELAAATSLNERYVREWANALVATGYVELDEGQRYRMTKEAIFFFGDPDSPGFTVGAYQLAYGVTGNVPRLIEHFRTGGGIGYADSGDDVTIGVERLWGPIHDYFLEGWLEAVPGLTERLRAGASILDIGCGRGRSTLSLAKLFPTAHVVGVDADPASIEAARERWRSRGASGDVTFKAQRAEDLPADGSHDFAYLFHTLHDIPEPVAALAAIRQTLKDDGMLLCVESAASADPMVNRGTPAEMFASVSPLFNLPVAMSVSGDGSGTILTEDDVRELAEKAGFSSYESIDITFPPPSALHKFHLIRK